KALAAMRKLQKNHPGNFEYGHLSALIQAELATLLLENDPSRTREAEDLFRVALAQWDKLAAENALAWRYRGDMANFASNLANFLTEQARYDEAIKLYRQAIAAQEELVADLPSMPTFQLELGRSLDNLANTLDDLDQTTEAEKLWLQAKK